MFEEERLKGWGCPRRKERLRHGVPPGETDVADQGPRRKELEEERVKGRVCPRRPERLGRAVPQGETDVVDQGPRRKEELEEDRLKGRVCPRRPAGRDSCCISGSTARREGTDTRERRKRGERRLEFS